MKNLEVTHTLRLYDPTFISNLGTLMEKERKNYRNRNEFMSTLMKMGYESYVKAASKSKHSPVSPDGDEAKEIYPLLQELSKYVSTQFKRLYIDNSIQRTVTAVIYNILRSVNKNEKLLTQKIDDGYYDDLPARFQKIIINLETRFGLK